MLEINAAHLTRERRRCQQKYGASPRGIAPKENNAIETSLVTHANAIRKCSFSVLCHWHVELRRKGRGPLCLEGRRNHFPVAANRLVHNHGDRAILMVANFD